MPMLPLLLALATAVHCDTTPVPDRPVVADAPRVLSVDQAPRDTIRRRPRSIEYSDAYATRLQIHRYGSYLMLPLFAAEYGLGQNLLNDASPPSWIKPTHAGVALGIGGLFTINTVTGAWNLWDSRQDPAGRTRRWIHTTLMLASDAGFAWAGAVGGGHSIDAEKRHRNIALGSIALSTAGAAMMWFWKD
jgi:hypothetical protein